MASADVQARRELLDELADAIDALAPALSALGAAYEQLDEQMADRLEEQLFQPIQRAYGRAKRTHTEFAARHGLRRREFQMRAPGLPSTGVKGFIEAAMDAVARSESELVTLQDSLAPIEYGDKELRAGLAEVRELMDGFSQRSRAFVSVFGR